VIANNRYLDNIRVFDEGIKKIEEIARDFFQDDQTAFVFSSDHGMSNRGSHGDGDVENTETPLIVWGSGISHSEVSLIDSFFSSLSSLFIQRELFES